MNVVSFTRCEEVLAWMDNVDDILLASPRDDLTGKQYKAHKDKLSVSIILVNFRF